MDTLDCPLLFLQQKKGYSVCGIDIQESKINLLNERRSPTADKILEQQLAESKNHDLTFTTDFSFLCDMSVVVVCVPTPVHEDHMPDLGPVEGATRSIAKHLVKGQLIVLESTVNPGVSEEVVLPILEKISCLKAGADFYLAHCPERINPGDPKWNVENIPRVVGSLEEKGLELALEFYRSILAGEVKPMGSLKEAEAVKIVENSFRDINIAFVNELAMSFSKLGIDVVNVINGAATKPFAFMAHYPSCGVGGHCIPVDPYYLIEYAKKNGFHHNFLAMARKINNHMPEFTVEQLIFALNEKKLALNGLTVAVLGLAYKANIEDYRESPAFEIIKHLERAGAKVKTFDPFVLQKSTAASLDEAMTGASAVIIATAHRQFRSLTPEECSAKGVGVVVDGCNCLSKEAFKAGGIIYRGIGR